VVDTATTEHWRLHLSLTIPGDLKYIEHAGAANKNVKFVPLASISAYQLLDKKQVLVADVFTTDPQLISTKYVQLRDPKNMFGFQHVAPVVKKTLIAENGTAFSATLNKVSALLTVKAMIAMNKAVIVDKKSAAKVAAAFLKANGLK
jgi:osmoprotectant transport system substrate-binding protein